jgi:hypothetical protein
VWNEKNFATTTAPAGLLLGQFDRATNKLYVHVAFNGGDADFSARTLTKIYLNFGVGPAISFAGVPMLGQGQQPLGFEYSYEFDL